MTDILTALAAPFPPEIVSWRVGSTNKEKTKGLALAYIDSRDVQDRLDAVCGVNWQVRHPWSCGTKLACEIGILINGEWLWRGDGAGDSDVEAEKGAFSDSFKRSAVRWGVGRYLYDIDSPWVAIEPMGKSYKIADSEKPKLRALLARISGTAPSSASPKAQPASAPAAKAPASRPAPPKKFDLLRENGELLAEVNDPNLWCQDLRRELEAPGAMVAALWKMNEPLAAVIRDHFPDVQWADRKGTKYPAYDFLAAIVRKLTPGIAA